MVHPSQSNHLDLTTGREISILDQRLPVLPTMPSLEVSLDEVRESYLARRRNIDVEMGLGSSRFSTSVP
jgi:hypothetical protein